MPSTRHVVVALAAIVALPGPRHRRALLLGQPQRLADLPGRRPDLARHLRLAPRKGTIGYALTSHGWPMLLAPLTWITGSSSVAAPAADDRAPGRRARADRDARGLRHRRPPRGPARRLWCAAAFVGRAVRRDPLLRPALPRLVGRPVPPAGARADQQADFPSVVAVLVSVAFTVRALRAGAYREAVLAGTFAGVALALKPANALFLGGPLARAPARPPLAHAAALRRRRWLRRSSRSRSGRSKRPRRGAALRPGRGDPARGGARRPGHGVRHELARPHRAPRTSTRGRENMSNLREFTWSARVAAVPAAGRRDRRRAPVRPRGGALPGLAARVRRRQGRRRRRDDRVGELLAPDHARPARVRAPRRVGPAARPDLRRPDGAAARAGPGRRPASTRRRPSSGSSPSSRSPCSCVALAVPRPAAEPAGRLRRPGAGRRRHRRARRTRTSSRSRFAASATPTCSAWTDSTTRARTFYRVYRSLALARLLRHGLRARGVDRCDLRAETLVTTRDAHVRRPRSARRRGLPDRRRGELARRRRRAATSSRSARPWLHRRRG